MILIHREKGEQRYKKPELRENGTEISSKGFASDLIWAN